MFDLFGAEMPLAVRFFLAFLIVLGLIGAAAWAVRRFGSARFTGAVRGRQPRLAVIEYATVDARRRLLLVRRDNVEHLMMIGGPTDVVVEANIVRAAPAAVREPAAPRIPAPGENLARAIPLPEADVEWLLAAAAGSSRHAGAISCAGAAWTAHRADVRRADQRRAAACRTDSSPATRGVDRARRRSFRRGSARCAGYAAAAAQPSRAANSIAAGRTAQRTSR